VPDESDYAERRRDVVADLQQIVNDLGRISGELDTLNMPGRDCLAWSRRRVAGCAVEIARVVPDD
jgi:hypothetical protein